jgi:hypothetical protein
VAKCVSRMHKGCSPSHKWLDTCLSCGKSHHVFKELFSPFAHSSSEHEKERREEKKKGRKEREKRKEKKRKEREKRKKGGKKRERERKGRKRKEKYENSKVIFSYLLWYF